MPRESTRWLLAITVVFTLSCAQAGTLLKTAQAELRDLPREYRLDGVVEAVKQTTVSAQTSGEVQEILFDVDDYVKKGAVIVRLKDVQQKARLSAAEADLKEAEARLKEAQDAFDRTKRIYAKKLASQSAMDKASATLKAARAHVDAAQAGFTQALEQLAYTRVRAPYSGIVTHRYVEKGEVAQPGQKLMSGISLDQLRVNVDVPQSLIRSIRRLGKARVQQPGNGWVDATKITVFPFADFGSNTFKVRLDLPEAIPDLFPGMFVKTAFVTGLKKVLVIPEQAVVHRSEVTGVYVVGGDDRIHFRHIRVGHETGDGQIEVLAGVDAGEKVALDPIRAGIVLKQQRAERKDG